MGETPAKAVVTSKTRNVAVALLFCVSLLNYLDRYVLSVLLPSIKKDLDLSDTELGDEFLKRQIEICVRYPPRATASDDANDAKDANKIATFFIASSRRWQLNLGFEKKLRLV